MMLENTNNLTNTTNSIHVFDNYKEIESLYK